MNEEEVTGQEQEGSIDGGKTVSLLYPIPDQATTLPPSDSLSFNKGRTDAISRSIEQ